MRTFGLLLCVAISGALVPRAAGQDYTALVKRVKPSVVTVLTYDNIGEEFTHGSGFLVARDEFVTCRHVINGASTVRIVTSDEKSFDVTGIIGEDIDGDLVLLAVHGGDTLSYSPLVISDSLPEEGQRIIVIGNPLGFDRSVADGLVSAVRRDAHAGHRIQMTVPLSHGSSGSPVVNLNGDVVGVATSSVESGQNINFAMPASRVRAMRRDPLQSIAAWNAARKPGTLSPVSALFFLGRSAFRHDSLESAVRHFEEAVTLDKDDADSWHWLGRCRERLGDYQGAVKAYSKSSTLNPTGNTYWRLGDVLAKIPDSEGAIAAYVTACQLLPRDTNLHYTLAAAYFNADRIDDAIVAAKEVLRIDERSISGRVLLGESYNHASRYAEAVEVLREAIRLCDTCTRAHGELSESYEKTGAFAQSGEECRIVLRRTPDDVLMWSHLAGVEDHLGHPDGALAAYQRATSLAPDDELLRFNLCVFACNHGTVAPARPHYRWLVEHKSTVAAQLAPCFARK